MYIILMIYKDIYLEHEIIIPLKLSTEKLIKNEICTLNIIEETSGDSRLVSNEVLISM